MQGDDGAQAETAGYSAFISHASEDGESAEAICQGLETAGFRCWIAPRDVRPGKIYLEEIIRGIELSKCLVLVLSSNANQAHMVRDEVERAYNKGKPIFPVRIEEVIPSRGLELLVSTAHWIDAWRGNLSQHIAKLVLRLAEGADLFAELPPELQRRIRWRRRARIAGIFSGSAAIAILVALIMRSTLIESTKDIYSVPPSVFLTGNFVDSSGRPKADVMIQDGYDQDRTYEIFRNPVNFELFDVSNGKPEEFFKSVPERFQSTYQAASPFDITIPVLPIRVVSCLSYIITKTNKHEAVLTGFSFNLPGSSAATYGIAPLGPTESYPVDAKPDCAALVLDYTTKYLKDLKPLTEGRTMASRVNIGTWKGDCTRDRENTALISCRLGTNQIMKDGVLRILLGFSPQDLNFTFGIDPIRSNSTGPSESSRDQFSVYLPNLGSTVYASWEYKDNSKSDVKGIGVAVGGSRPTAVIVHANSSDAPVAYVAYDPSYLPKWGLVVVDDPDVVQMDWSRDGRGFTRMDGKGGVFFTILTPSAFGIAEPMPPPEDETKDLWLRFVTAAGQSRVYRYPVDLWRIAREQLRGSQPPETLISCGASDQYIKHSTQGELKVLCRFPNPPDSMAGPGLMFQKIWWGLEQEELHDLTDFRPKAANFAPFLRNWRECFIGACNGGVLALSENAMTVLFKFRYWDGKETEVVAVPVK